MNLTETHTVRIDGRVRKIAYTATGYASQGSRHSGPHQNRWREVSVYVRPAGGILLIHRRISQWQGEGQSHSAWLLDSAAAASAWAHRQDDVTSDLAIEALRAAGVYVAPEAE